jgi:membrane-bound ClpP family serine protease
MQGGPLLTKWRTILLAAADDALAAAVLIIAMAWLAAEGVIAPAIALVLVAVGVTILAIFAYKTAKALLMSPKIGTGMAGKKGIAVSDIKPNGMILVEGELWKASSQGRIEKGAAVVITRTEGLRAIVDAEKNG